MTAIHQLLNLMAALRDKETGCPWDIEQNFSTISPHTVEEAYEVADAIARNDMVDLRNELGDLLLQVVFHAQMAKEAGLFDFEDVATAITEKLISRHPHIFGEETVNTAQEQTEKWEAIKAKEREEKALKKGIKHSILDDIPRNLPSMMRATKIQKRAAKTGFNWEHIEQIFDKLQEEIIELKAEIPANNTERITHEIGDILFVVCNIANYFHVNPEAALSSSNSKFERRFHYIEEELSKQNRTPEEATLEEMDALWNIIRAKEKI